MRLIDLLEEGLKRSMDKLKEKERDKVRKSGSEGGRENISVSVFFFFFFCFPAHEILLSHHEV